jgi:hypothetical protein
MAGEGAGAGERLAGRNHFCVAPTAAQGQGERAWPDFEAFRSYHAHLPQGRHIVEYTVRLNNPGRFALPPTRVEAMYAPESFGEAPNAALEVAP